MMAEHERAYIWQKLRKLRPVQVGHLQREDDMLQRIYSGGVLEPPRLNIGQIHAIRQSIISDITELMGYMENNFRSAHVPKTTVTIFRDTQERLQKIRNLSKRK